MNCATPYYTDAAPVLQGRRVRVHWNVRRLCWSVLAKVGRSWKLLAHAASIDLENVRLTVHEGGRQRVLKTGRKNVHAWLEGDVTDFVGKAKTAVRYNPRRDVAFVDDQGRPVRTAWYAVLRSPTTVRVMGANCGIAE